MNSLKMLLPFVLFYSSLFGQENQLTKKTIDLIVKTYNFQDNNPSHYIESNLVDSVFKVVVFDYFNVYKPEKEPSKQFILEMLLSNGSSDYDDSYDIRRMKMRRSLCFASLALKTEVSSSKTFFEYAEFSIFKNYPSEIEPLLESEFCGLLFLEILVSQKNNNKYEMKTTIEKLENFISRSKDKIDSEDRTQMEKLLNDYKKTII